MHMAILVRCTLYHFVFFQGLAKNSQFIWRNIVRSSRRYQVLEAHPPGRHVARRVQVLRRALYVHFIQQRLSRRFEYITSTFDRLNCLRAARGFVALDDFSAGLRSVMPHISVYAVERAFRYLNLNLSTVNQCKFVLVNITIFQIQIFSVSNSLYQILVTLKNVHYTVFYYFTLCRDFILFILNCIIFKDA